MEEAFLDPLVAFSWLASKLLGRAVSACMQAHSASTRANPAYRNVTLELAQSEQRPQEIMLKGAHLQTILSFFLSLARR
jgi:hypothetical protein